MMASPLTQLESNLFATHSQLCVAQRELRRVENECVERLHRRTQVVQQILAQCPDCAASIHAVCKRHENMILKVTQDATHLYAAGSPRYRICGGPGRPRNGRGKE